MTAASARAPAWLSTLLLAVPFLVGIAALRGLTVEIDTFHGSDARVYHLPSIEHFAAGLDFDRYPAAQTPLFHLLFAGWGEVVGFELWKLRLLNVAVSYLAVLVLFRFLARELRLERPQARPSRSSPTTSPSCSGCSHWSVSSAFARMPRSPPSRSPPSRRAPPS
jgi:hypothetical protein